MFEFLIVGVGGFLGSITRFGVSQLFFNNSVASAFPLATFIVNIAGCLVIGLLAGLAEGTLLISAPMRLFLFTGILGGFTTFSAFGLETVQLARNEQFRSAFLYVASSIIVGFVLVWLGINGGRCLGSMWFGRPD